uniref:Gfo/Idh/MocA-like oxidoreductase domain containing 1 n=1 Tax=Bos indicus x Bos taurus TaxID=30522 RepID=A0A4W2BRM7_BOBOX
MLPGVGVFGTSLTARVIIPLLKDEGFAVKALWGRTQEEAEELAKEMSVPFYTSRIDEVLLHQDVDLVCINLPPPLTRQIAVKTLGNVETLDLEMTGLGLIRGFIFTGKSLDLTLLSIVSAHARWVGHLGLLCCHSWRLNACNTGSDKPQTVMGPAWPLRVCRY